MIGTCRRLMTLIALFVLAGCTVQDDGMPGDDPSAGSTAGLVLRVRHVGGLAGTPPGTGEIPDVSVYTDGRMITPGPRILIYPPPALPSVQVQQIGVTRVQEFVDRAVTAGVRPDTDFGDPGIADATTTRITVHTAGTEQTVAIVALREAAADDADLTPAQQAVRRDIKMLLGDLDRLPTDPALPRPEPYRSDALAILSRPHAAASPAPASPAPALAWPGPALPGQELPDSAWTGCVITVGSKTEQIRSAAEDASTATAWTWQGRAWSVTLRPLLPEESQCAELSTPR